ncbi:methionyl-tRNA formyltransferase [Tepidibacillus fermentans]|uniref:Methionyl-tRNA formyltransferase n=1 Tax=Tepidibacillus fermentans TaxID=1281767 RepID=A0A4R3KLA2_9BACI|nr:methionyl-tRNA formyltransferase [Tepidibacillus fermentans]TCS84360.1 methionyl-tRNA formyltransferase [Tepidibacillus fermentans]
MRIVFMGTPDFAVPSLQSLVDHGYNVVGVVTQPDRPKGRKQILTPSPVKELAIKLGLEVFQPERIKREEAIEHVLSWKPDLIVTAAYGQIIPEPLLFTPKFKAINVHASLLPKYRGAAPIHQSIIHGEKETGVTIMYMVKELDAGDILSQAKVVIESDDTVGTLHDKLSQVGKNLLIETIKKIEEGTIHPIPQDDHLATYAPMIKREDERIVWNKTSTQIYNQIRGMNPWPVAFTTYKGQNVKVWWAEPFPYHHETEPGTILRVTKDQLLVATKDGAIELKEIQPAGKKKMDIVSFLQGAQVQEGEKLGEINEQEVDS